MPTSGCYLETRVRVPCLGASDMKILRLPTLILIVCLAGMGPAQAQEAIPVRPGDPAAGDDVFIKCSGCHQVGPGSANSIGPQLNGVVGRISGSVAGYDYSAALKDAKIRWTHDEIAAFVTNPQALAPGTKMSYAGLKNRQDVEDLIAYLGRFDEAGQTK